jgi:ubiquinone/menaquinone biosynthesis C-methylase UbiE
MERVLEPEVMDTAEEAAEYDAMDHGGANEAFVRRAVELGASGRVLDVGCGPGGITLLLAAELDGAHVTGVDLARHMLVLAEEKRTASPHATRLAFRHADAKGLPFDDASFDAVVSNTILHHVPEPLAFLAEVRRVLRPGGALLVRDLFRPETPERARELADLHAADATPAQRELLRASLCAALTPEELRAVADEAGLGDAELVVDSDRHASLQRAAR